LTNIQGSPIVISKDTEEGSIGLFFPAECTISPEFLSKNNLFKRSEMNADQTQKGYFETSGRVKALKLVKGTVISTGFYIPLTSLSYACDISKLNVGDTFNEVNGIFICKKYIPKAIQNAIARSKNDKLASKFKKLIPDQFRLHEDTSKLAMNLHRLRPSDVIAITSKWHGTSAVFANVLVKKELKWYEKALKKIGIPIVTEEYANICASRKVIKTLEINDGDQNHFYDVDIWTHVNNYLQDSIEKGITLYGEIVGFLETGAAIQSMAGSAYDYGCAPMEHKFLVYRITYTTPQGKVIEFSWQQIKEYCERYELQYVPEYYFGSLKDFYIRFVDSSAETLPEDFADRLFAYLQSAFNLEKYCEFCSNKVPAEGIVLRRDGKTHYEAYKLKSRLFLLKESEALDNGEVDMETQETV
jgi:hypothetical protein